MRIYVNTDLEGISGVYCKEHLFPGGRLYNEARVFLSQQVNAAIEGAYDGGADEVIVLDGHGGSCHLLLDEMDAQAVYIQGSGRPDWLPRLEGCDGMLMIGWHAMAGTPAAVLDHTQSLEGLRSITVNGMEIGEIGQCVMIAGAWGVPLLMIAGDDKACAEATGMVPGIKSAVLKDSLSRFSAVQLHPRRACELLKETATEAVSLVGKIKPYELPKGEITVHIQLATTDLAQQTLQCYSPPTCESRLIDGRTIEHKADDIRKIFP